MCFDQAMGAHVKVFMECCLGSTDRVIEIGGDPDGIANTVYACYECLQTVCDNCSEKSTRFFLKYAVLRVSALYWVYGKVQVCSVINSLSCVVLSFVHFMVVEIENQRFGISQGRVEESYQIQWAH
jgi:hypothetical protein